MTQKVEDLHERSRQSYAQVHERIDAHDKNGQMLKAQIQKLNHQLRLLNDRLVELEKPRGLRAWFGRLFGRGKPKDPATTVSTGKNLEEAAKEVPS